MTTALPSIRTLSVSLAVLKQSWGATALSYQQSLSYGNRIYNVPWATCLAGAGYLSLTNTMYRTQWHSLIRSSLHVCMFEVKKPNSQFM